MLPSFIVIRRRPGWLCQPVYPPGPITRSWKYISDCPLSSSETAHSAPTFILSLRELMVRPCASSTFDTTPEGSVAHPGLLHAIAAIATLGINLLNRMMSPPSFVGGMAPVGARNTQY